MPYIAGTGAPVAEAVGEVLRRHGIEHQDVPEAPRGVQGQRVSMMSTRLAEILVPGLEITPRRRDPSTRRHDRPGSARPRLPPGPTRAGRPRRIAAELVADAHVPLVLWRPMARTVRSPGPRPAASGFRTTPQPFWGTRHPFLDEAARDLVRVCQHLDAGDLVLSGWRRNGLPLSFPHENGSHAGPGPSETQGLRLRPRRRADRLVEAEPSMRPSCAPPRSPCSRAPVNDPALAGPAHPTSPPCVCSPTTCTAVSGSTGCCRSTESPGSSPATSPMSIALQEIDVERSRSGGIDQAREIADRLGLLLQLPPDVRGGRRAVRRRSAQPRCPWRRSASDRCPDCRAIPNWNPGASCGSRWNTGDAVFQVLNTHLSVHPRERRLQVERIDGSRLARRPRSGCQRGAVRRLQCRSRVPDVPTIGRTLTDVQVGLDGHRPRRTWGGRHPLARIDHIFVGRRLEVVHVDVPSTHLTRTASDHLPLLADLRTRSPG